MKLSLTRWQHRISKSIRWELLDYNTEKQKLIIFKGTVINESGGGGMTTKSQSRIWSLSIHTASQENTVIPMTVPAIAKMLKGRKRSQ